MTETKMSKKQVLKIEVEPHEFKAGDDCPFCDGKLTSPTQCNQAECWFNKVTFH